eukprot:9302753-Alexandrium_andersonii.AAC.1
MSRQRLAPSSLTLAGPRLEEMKHFPTSSAPMPVAVWPEPSTRASGRNMDGGRGGSGKTKDMDPAFLAAV